MIYNVHVYANNTTVLNNACKLSLPTILIVEGFYSIATGTKVSGMIIYLMDGDEKNGVVGFLTELPNLKK